MRTTFDSFATVVSLTVILLGCRTRDAHERTSVDPPFGVTMSPTPLRIVACAVCGDLPNQLNAQGVLVVTAPEDDAAHLTSLTLRLRRVADGATIVDAAPPTRTIVRLAGSNHIERGSRLVIPGIGVHFNQDAGYGPYVLTIGATILTDRGAALVRTIAVRVEQ